MTDVTVNGALPDGIQSLLAWVVCITGAGSVQEYVSILDEASFTGFTIEDKRDTLQEIVRDIQRRLLGLGLVARLEKLDPGEHALDNGKKMLRCVADLIEKGTLGYTLIAARKV